MRTPPNPRSHRPPPAPSRAPPRLSCPRARAGAARARPRRPARRARPPRRRLPAWRALRLRRPPGTASASTLRGPTSPTAECERGTAGSDASVWAATAVGEQREAGRACRSVERRAGPGRVWRRRGSRGRGRLRRRIRTLRESVWGGWRGGVRSGRRVRGGRGRGGRGRGGRTPTYCAGAQLRTKGVEDEGTKGQRALANAEQRKRPVPRWPHCRPARSSVRQRRRQDKVGRTSPSTRNPGSRPSVRPLRRQSRRPSSSMLTSQTVYGILSVESVRIRCSWCPDARTSAGGNGGTGGTREGGTSLETALAGGQGDGRRLEGRGGTQGGCQHEGAGAQRAEQRPSGRHARK